MDNLNFVEYKEEIYVIVGISDLIGAGLGYVYHLVDLRHLEDELLLAGFSVYKVPIKDCKEITDPKKIEMLKLLFIK